MLSPLRLSNSSVVCACDSLSSILIVRSPSESSIVSSDAIRSTVSSCVIVITSVPVDASTSVCPKIDLIVRLSLPSFESISVKPL